MSLPKIQTPVCSLFNIEYPLVLAGMGGFVSPSGPDLAAAVSNAGGLGVLGGAFVSPEGLRLRIQKVRELTDKPFGVNTLIPFSVTQGDLKNPTALSEEIPEQYLSFLSQFKTLHGLNENKKKSLPLYDPTFIREQLEVVLEEKVDVYVSGLGNPEFILERAHQQNMKVGVVLGNSLQAKKALETGVDFVVAQGHDGGGHNSKIGTMALIPQVVDALEGKIPVLAAGSIVDGRQMAAALLLGAQGVWCGSAFLATEEADITQKQKEEIVSANETDTVVTKSYSGKPARVLKGLWTEAFDRSGLKPLPMHQQLQLSDSMFSAANLDENIKLFPGVGGQGIGLIKKIRPAKDVFEGIVFQAHETLTKRSMSLILQKDI